MKKVEVILEYCWSICPYYEYENSACDFFTPAKKFNPLDAPSDFPEWCPLHDYDPKPNP